MKLVGSASRADYKRERLGGQLTSSSEQLALLWSGRVVKILKLLPAVGDDLSLFHHQLEFSVVLYVGERVFCDDDQVR